MATTKHIFFLAFLVLALAPLAYAHGLLEEAKTARTTQYELTFVSEPLYPITWRTTTLVLTLNTLEGQVVSGANIALELHAPGKRAIRLPAPERTPGTYAAAHRFNAWGTYDVHIAIQGQELDAEFELFVDRIGPRGWARVVTILVLFFVLAWFAARECAKARRAEAAHAKPKLRKQRKRKQKRR